MSGHPWFSHLTVAAVIEQDGRFLLVEEHPRHHNVINQPAGHVEEDESIIAAVCRETLEETGYAIRPDYLIGLYYFQGTNGVTYMRVCFSASIESQPHNGPTDPDITATHWLTLDELSQKSIRSPVVLQCIEDYQSGKHYPLSMISDFINASVP